MEKRINYVDLILVIVAALLWMFAPFAAVTLFSVGNQPTAFETLTGDFFYLGDIKDSTAYIAALGTLVALLAAFISVISKKSTGVRISAVVGILSMLPVFFEIVSFFEEDVFEGFFELFGLGFCGVGLLLIILVFITKEAYVPTNTPNDYNNTNNYNNPNSYNYHNGYNNSNNYGNANDFNKAPIFYIDKS